MLRSRLFFRPEPASLNNSPLQVGETSSLYRIWLATAVDVNHAYPAKYHSVNKVPTLRATNMNSRQRPYYWSLDITSIGVMHIPQYVCIHLITKSSIIVAVSGEPLTALDSALESAFCVGWVEVHLLLSVSSVSGNCLRCHFAKQGTQAFGFDEA